VPVKRSVPPDALENALDLFKGVVELHLVTDLKRIYPVHRVVGAVVLGDTPFEEPVDRPVPYGDRRQLVAPLMK